MTYQVRTISGRVWGRIGFILLIVLAACEPAATLTPTRVRTLSGPTIAASPVVLPLPPTDPVDGYYGQNDPTAAALPGSGELPPLPIGGVEQGGQIVQITAEDGGLINGVLYQSGLIRQPGILLLAPDHTTWGTFPAKLADAGFTVLSISMRPGGGITDFNVLLRALSSGEADPGRLGAIGAGIGADTVFLGCVADMLCDTVILLSPTQHDVLLAAMPGYNPRAIFTTASQEDATAYATAQDLAAAATGESFFQPFENAGSGTTIIQNRPDLGDLIIQWLDGQFAE
ncbi:MAG: hypothetical protein H6671_11270 [Anaerolineaceae bacterium]|nr:hypothetical protein [Anaerolineaceae bacterium]